MRGVARACVPECDRSMRKKPISDTGPEGLVARHRCTQSPDNDEQNLNNILPIESVRSVSIAFGRRKKPLFLPSRFPASHRQPILPPCSPLYDPGDHRLLVFIPFIGQRLNDVFEYTIQRTRP